MWKCQSCRRYVFIKGQIQRCQYTMTVKKFIKNVRRKSASTSNHHKRLPPPKSSSKTRWHIGRFKAAPYKSSNWLLANMPVSSVSKVQWYWCIFPLHDEAVKLPEQLKEGKIYKQTATVITIKYSVIFFFTWKWKEETDRRYFWNNLGKAKKTRFSSVSWKY